MMENEEGGERARGGRKKGRGWLEGRRGGKSLRRGERERASQCHWEIGSLWVCVYSIRSRKGFSSQAEDWRTEEEEAYPQLCDFFRVFFVPCTQCLFSVCIRGRYWQGQCKVREVRGRGKAAQTSGREREEERQNTLMQRKHASGCCLLRGQDSQNEKLPQEHFTRAHPAQKGKISFLTCFYKLLFLLN